MLVAWATSSFCETNACPLLRLTATPRTPTSILGIATFAQRTLEVYHHYAVPVVFGCIGGAGVDQNYEVVTQNATIAAPRINLFKGFVDTGRLVNFAININYVRSDRSGVIFFRAFTI